MKKMIYTIRIQAPLPLVFDCMLGLSNRDTYKDWTAEFNPTSDYEGEWKTGAKMLFTGVNENGEKGGMVSFIEVFNPNTFVSISHKGMLKGNEEILSGPDVEAWAGAHENYSFSQEDKETVVKVEIDVAEAFTDYFNETYPKALQRLKVNTESR